MQLLLTDKILHCFKEGSRLISMDSFGVWCVCGCVMMRTWPRFGAVSEATRSRTSVHWARHSRPTRCYTRWGEAQKHPSAFIHTLKQPFIAMYLPHFYFVQKLARAVCSFCELMEYTRCFLSTDLFWSALHAVACGCVVRHMGPYACRLQGNAITDISALAEALKTNQTLRYLG